MARSMEWYDRKVAEICAMYAEGGIKISSACEQYDLSWGTFWELKAQNPKYEQMYQQAKRSAAMKHAERAVDAAEEANPENVKVKRLQSDVHLRMAGILNREEFGESKQAPQVQVNIGALHLEALLERKKLKAEATLALPDPSGGDVEVVAD